MATENKQWSLVVPPLATVQPFSALRGTKLPTGPYEVLIKEVVDYQKEPGKSSLKFIATVTEAGEHAGNEVWLFQNIDFSKAKDTNDAVYRGWATILRSVGAPPAMLGQQLNLGPQSFAGKKAFIYVKAAPEGEQNKNDDRNFITPEEYLKIKAQGAQVAATTPASTQQVQSFGTPAVGSAMAPAGGGIPQPGLPAGVPQPTMAGMNQLGATLGAPVAQAPAGNGGVSF